MSCHIKTNDGYEKEIPWIDEIIGWNLGQTVEIYHSEYHWTQQYKIHSVTFDYSVKHAKIELFAISNTKVFNDGFSQYDETMDRVSKGAAGDIANEIDADILRKILDLAKHLKP